MDREDGARFVGLAGPAGAGKDYCHQWLRDHSTLQVLRASFADGLKFEIAETLHLTDPMVLFRKPHSETIRRLLQWWGTELRRATDPDYWVKVAITNAVEHATPGTLTAFTDVRFANEAQAVRNLGGIVLMIKAPKTVRAFRLGNQLPDSTHASEKMDFPQIVDGAIDNTTNEAAPLFPVERHEYLGLTD